MTDNGPMLKVDDIHTYYGDSYVLQGLSLEIAEGQVMAVLGRNGMGKTTLIRSIIGFTKPRTGKVTFDGADITALQPHEIVKLGVALVPQGRRIFPSLTVMENLLLGEKEGSADGGEESWDTDRVLALFPRLKERLRNMGNQLSGGEQQMLAFARSLMTNPKMLLLDEPTEGLAPLLVRAMGETLSKLKESKLAILLVEQNMKFALAACDYVHVLNRGRVVHSSTPDELAANEEIKSRFLGV
jgi:branched-chain amino acid transport system ATP-binding protein